MMKISFIIATLNSGGAERALVTLANALCKEHEVSIIKFHAGESFYKLENEVKVTSLEQFRFDTLYHKIASRFKKFFALRKALKESKADVFISFLDTTNIACIAAKIGLKTPLIISEHSNEAYLKPKIWRFLRRVSYPFCDALSVLGSSDKVY
ncbi:GalNAc-alpha-(1-_4)-GalNAc-alpha-(1-_3)-diNAcBac-PP-undecaprenol alpha-1,4-N-acetyl-D-galactosaminyltransferase, partial [Campylobacter jejuni]|nr:GalNAc-alpha-(1->4)-GalNAc-alpha-(1->3)-diNAcBac-PP-undecaprenol alpha-1,4-N-acetyl-D-galactosaminyltransferase [Campylobacter jejuni]